MYIDIVKPAFYFITFFKKSQDKTNIKDSNQNKRKKEGKVYRDHTGGERNYIYYPMRGKRRYRLHEMKPGCYK